MAIRKCMDRPLLTVLLVAMCLFGLSRCRQSFFPRFLSLSCFGHGIARPLALPPRAPPVTRGHTCGLSVEYLSRRPPLFWHSFAPLSPSASRMLLFRCARMSHPFAVSFISFHFISPPSLSMTSHHPLSLLTRDRRLLFKAPSP